MWKNFLLLLTIIIKSLFKHNREFILLFNYIRKTIPCLRGDSY